MNLTQGIIIGVIVALIVYDVFAGRLGQPTESQVLRDWSRNWTIMPFMAGLLMTHWFAPRAHPDISGWGWCLPMMALLIGVDIGWNVWGGTKEFIVNGVKLASVTQTTPWWRYPYVYAVLGMPFGFFLWPQGWF